jgi:histidinol dehydrogenase
LHNEGSRLLEARLEGLAAIGPAGVSLATAEGLPAHAASIALRLKAANRV